MRHRRWFAKAILFAAVFGASRVGTASEARPAIVVGEVSGSRAGADDATLGLLRRLVEREIGRLELDHPTRPVSYVFSASLERLDTQSSREGSRAVCIVSGALRRAGSGAIVALMRGSGAVDGDKAGLPGTRARALEVAVHGAVRRLPEAL
jgi:hypothetical protein